MGTKFVIFPPLEAKKGRSGELHCRSPVQFPENIPKQFIEPSCKHKKIRKLPSAKLDLSKTNSQFTYLLRQKIRAWRRNKSVHVMFLL